jgi:hypothetical protein
VVLLVAAAGLSAGEKALKIAAMTAAKNACFDAVVAKVMHHEGSYVVKKGGNVYSIRLDASKVRTYLSK